MGRLARSLVDLKQIVDEITAKGRAWSFSVRETEVVPTWENCLVDYAAQADRENTEAIISRHERGLNLVLIVFMTVGIGAGFIMIIGALGGDHWLLLPGFVAIAIGILSALGRVLVDMSRDLKRLYYLD